MWSYLSHDTKIYHISPVIQTAKSSIVFNFHCFWFNMTSSVLKFLTRQHTEKTYSHTMNPNWNVYFTNSSLPVNKLLSCLSPIGTDSACVSVFLRQSRYGFLRRSRYSPSYGNPIYCQPLCSYRCLKLLLLSHRSEKIQQKNAARHRQKDNMPGTLVT